jgi:hypothetical protein
MASASEIQVILGSLRETLEAAEAGLAMIKSNRPEQRRSGLRNLAVFGRAVTNVIQNLRSKVAGFDDWYQPWVQRMRLDPVANHFYKLRSEILKQGQLRTTATVYIDQLDLHALMVAAPKPPPNATSFFVGDNAGGTGWVVTLPDGSTEKFYVEIPQGVPGVQVTVDLHLADAPPEIRGISVGELGDHYVSMLRAITREARERFFPV